MSNLTLFTCLIEEHGEDKSFIQVYWAYAEHIGAAIEKMLAAARRNGLRNPEPKQLDPYDVENLQDEVQPDADAEVFWSEERYFFDSEPEFSIPYGVIASCVEGDYDIEEIEAGFTREKDDEGKTTFTVNVEREELLNVYARLLEARENYRVFWYRIHDHWDDLSDHFLVNESLNTPELILNHLVENELDSVLNGYVTLTAYCEEGATNLNISEHKQIVIFTYSDEVANDLTEILNEAGFPEVDELVSFTEGIHHWHFRHPEALARPDLIEHLYSEGFSDWTPD